MKVSVIIPNYNHATYLEQRINSVLQQSYKEFEVIILDDCSSDNSHEIIERYKTHPKISSVIFNQQNSGSPFTQWNKGIQIAKGDWIWIAESDDFAHPELLQVLINKAKTCTKTVLAYCQSFEINEVGTVVRNLSWHVEDLDDKHWKKDFCVEGQDEIKNYLVHRNTIPNASAVLFKKSAFLKADQQFMEMRLCGDWFLWVQLLQQGSVAFCAHPLNYFRTHAGTTRVLNNNKKMQLRLEEEYKVLLQINKDEASRHSALIKTRLREVSRLYSTYFTRIEILQILLNSFAYKSPVPKMQLLKYYLVGKLKL